MSQRTRSATRKLSSQSKQAATAAGPAVSASETPPIVLFEHQAAWETWLEAHHSDTLTGIWLKISKKGSATASVSYDEALDAALCFGWIDGQRKSHDDQHFLQRFTPRRKNSLWSQRNVAKVGVLIESGRVRAPGHAEIDAAKADGRWQRAYASSSNVQVPDDFRAALDASRAARTFFDSLGRSQRYSFLWRIETAKRPDTRSRRVAQFVQLLAEQKTL